jgi:predicted double-glycine peptidase
VASVCRSLRLCITLSALAFAACAGRLPGAGPTPTLPTAEPWSKVPGIILVRQEGRTDCGSAALTTVLSRFDPRIDPARVRRAVGPSPAPVASPKLAQARLAGPNAEARPGDGLAAGRLRDVARAEGLQAYVIEATFADLAHEIDSGRPVLVGVYRVVGDRGYPHYEVVAGINARDQQVLLADPATGWHKEPLAQFGARWRLARNLAVVVLGSGPSKGPALSGHPPVARNDDHGQQAN